MKKIVPGLTTEIIKTRKNFQLGTNLKNPKIGDDLKQYKSLEQMVIRAHQNHLNEIKIGSPYIFF